MDRQKPFLNKKSAGFTLAELLVVLSIISLLASITLVYVQKGRDKARIAKIRQFSTSIYHTLPDIKGFWNFDDGTANGLIETQWDKSPWDVYSASVEDGGVSGKALKVEWGYVTFEKLAGLPKPESGAITVEGWAKRDVGEAGQLYIATACYHYCTIFPWTLQHRYGNIVRWQIYNGLPTNGYCYFYSDVSNVPYFNPDSWNHFTGTYDGINKLRLFVNGYEVTTGFNGSCSGSFYAGWPGNDYWKITIGSGDSYGYIDEVRVYYEALSDVQIKQHYTEGARKRGLLVEE